MSIHSWPIFAFVQGGVIKTNGDKNNGKYHSILEAAVRVFAKKGFFQTKVAQIAKEAGVADGTIYLYFKNKDDILYQFFSYRTKTLFESFRGVVDQERTATQKLGKLVFQHLLEYQNDPDFTLVFQAEARQNRHLVKDEIKKISTTYLELLSEIIVQGQQEGCIRKGLNVGLTSRFILSAVDGVINTWVLSGCRYDMTKMADPLVNLMIQGIGEHSSVSDR